MDRPTKNILKLGWTGYCELRTLGHLSSSCCYEYLPSLKTWLIQFIFHNETLRRSRKNKVSIDDIPDHLKSIVFRQQLLKTHNHCFHLQYKTILLRLMALERSIETSNFGYLSPFILQLIVLRYNNELYKSDTDTYLNSSINHFDIAKQVCKALSELDFRNFVWHIGGDKPAYGNTLKVFHQIYLGNYMTPNITFHTTKIIYARYCPGLRGRKVLRNSLAAPVR